MSAEVRESGPGIGELTWSPQLQDQGVIAAAGAVRAVVEAAFAGGQHRVEVRIDPRDTVGQRIASFSGMRREGIARGVANGEDRVVFARLATDLPPDQAEGFRSILNAQLPRKRAIGQMLMRDEYDRVLLCELTYKRDHDLPGGVVEVGESPREATSREIAEELGIEIPSGELLLTDWLPAWSGWDDAVCLVFDGGVHDSSLIERIVKQPREIHDVRFRTLDEINALAADFTARRIAAALAVLDQAGPGYTESGRS